MPDRRPQSDEHAPHHLHYISLVTKPILVALREQRTEVARALIGVREEAAAFRYAEGKWSVREVVGHLSDAERIYTYRALAMARRDDAPLPKFDPDGYVAAAQFETRKLPRLVDEFLAVRDSTIDFFENLPDAAWSYDGTLNDARVSVRAMAYIAAGHVKRHLDVLRDRYGIGG
jgi:hypothetical protein